MPKECQNARRVQHFKYLCNTFSYYLDFLHVNKGPRKRQVDCHILGGHGLACLSIKVSYNYNLTLSHNDLKCCHAFWKLIIFVCINLDYR